MVVNFVFFNIIHRIGCLESGRGMVHKHHWAAANIFFFNTIHRSGGPESGRGMMHNYDSGGRRKVASFSSSTSFTESSVWIPDADAGHHFLEPPSLLKLSLLRVECKVH